VRDHKVALIELSLEAMSRLQLRFLNMTSAQTDDNVPFFELSKDTMTRLELQFGQNG